MPFYFVHPDDGLPVFAVTNVYDPHISPSRCREVAFYCNRNFWTALFLLLLRNTTGKDVFTIDTVLINKCLISSCPGPPAFLFSPSALCCPSSKESRRLHIPSTGAFDRVKALVKKLHDHIEESFWNHQSLGDTNTVPIFLAFRLSDGVVCATIMETFGEVECVPP